MARCGDAHGVFLPWLHRCAVLCGVYANERLRCARLGQSSPLQEHPARIRESWVQLNGKLNIECWSHAGAPPQVGKASRVDGYGAVERQPRQPGMCGVFVKGRGLSERGTSEFRSPGRNTPRVPGGSSSPEPHHQHSLPAQHRTARKRTEQRAPNAKQNFKA